MAESTAQAGQYTLLASHFEQRTSKATEPFEGVVYRRGETVKLNAEEATRLLGFGLVEKPGQSQRAEASRLLAAAEQLAEQAKAAERQATEAAKADELPAPPSGGQLLANPVNDGKK